jgi:hypothetical protein
LQHKQAGARLLTHRPAQSVLWPKEVTGEITHTPPLARGMRDFALTILSATDLVAVIVNFISQGSRIYATLPNNTVSQSETIRSFTYTTHCGFG